jgi:hypothetical protein
MQRFIQTSSTTKNKNLSVVKALYCLKRMREQYTEDAQNGTLEELLGINAQVKHIHRIKEILDKLPIYIF